MPDQKISQLTDGGASQATDEYVIARSGSNFRIDGASVAAAATSVGTLASLTVTGTATVGTVAGTTITEGGSPIVRQTDLGSAANEIPLNQYLGTMAYQDAAAINVGSINATSLTSTGAALVQNVGITGTASTQTKIDTVLGNFENPNADNVAVDIFTVAIGTGSFSIDRTAVSGTLKVAITGRTNAPQTIAASYTVPFLLYRISSGNVALSVGTGTLIKYSSNAAAIDVSTVTLSLTGATNTAGTLQLTVDLTGTLTGLDALDYVAALDVVQSSPSSHRFTFTAA